MGLAAPLVGGHKKYLRLWALESEWTAHSVLLCHTGAEISPEAESLWQRNEGSFITISHGHSREEPEQLPTIILTPSGNNLWFFHHCWNGYSLLCINLTMLLSLPEQAWRGERPGKLRHQCAFIPTAWEQCCGSPLPLGRSQVMMQLKYELHRARLLSSQLCSNVYMVPGT